jgi:LPXTG-motif cell wall-anchored protein
MDHMMLSARALSAALLTVLPRTGDRMGQMVWIVVGVLVVAAIVIVALLLTSRKKK